MNASPQKDVRAALASQASDDDEVTLSDLLATLWRGKFWILLTAIIGTALGGYHAFARAVPEYTASATVALESRQEQVVDIESVMTGLSGDQATINTEVEVFRSRGLVTKLVNQLDLTVDPEFNTALRPEPTYSVGKGIDWVREQIQGPPPVEPPASDLTIQERTVSKVLEALAISNVRQSYVFRITVTTESAEKSALMANTLAELYILEQLEVKFAATEKATQWLAERVAQLQVELETAEEQLKEFSADTELVSPEALIALNLQLKDLRDRRSDVANELKATELRLAALRDVAETGTPQQKAAAAEGIGGTDLEALLGQVDAGSARARDVFDQRFSQILDRALLLRDRLATQTTALDGSILEVEKQIAIQSEELVTLQQLQREAEASRLIYEYFLGRLKETSVQQGIQQADSRILSRAVIPSSPSAPRKSVIVALALFLGAAAGAGLVLAREFAQNTYRVAEQLEARTGYTVLGQIPVIPARRRKKVLKYLSERPNSAAAEAIRNLRTSVLLSDLDNPPQVIMSTSSVPGEGKTTMSLALTQNLAGLDKKVLLIEGDIRRRTFAQYFNIKDRKGLLSVLSKEVPLEEAAVREPTLNADVLIGEKSSTNAADVFSSARFKDFLDELRKTYDYIIIDTPPVLAVPDARVIGQSVDAIIYSVKWDQTTRRQVNDGLKSFESVNLKVAGLVLGQISPKGMKRYGYGDSYGAYNSYYNN